MTETRLTIRFSTPQHNKEVTDMVSESDNRSTLWNKGNESMLPGFGHKAVFDKNTANFTKNGRNISKAKCLKNQNEVK